MMSDIRNKDYIYVFNCILIKEVCDTLEMIHGDFPKIKQERMYIYIQEDETSNEYECHFHR